MGTKTVIGVDPGVNGGLAQLEVDTGKVVSFFSFTNTTVDELVSSMVSHSLSMKSHLSTSVYLEKVGFIKGDGGKGSFTFGKVYGGLMFGFKCLGMDVLDVSPVIWQSRMCCMTGGNKNVSKRRAIELFPGLHTGLKYGITHALADALLIAEYGRKQEIVKGRILQ